jgi:hypothetical protein
MSRPAESRLTEHELYRRDLDWLTRCDVLIAEAYLVAIMRFPSADAVRVFLESAAYRAQIVHRSQAFADVRSYIASDLTETPVG